MQDKLIQGAQNINEIFGVGEFYFKPFTLYLALRTKTIRTRFLAGQL